MLSRRDLFSSAASAALAWSVAPAFAAADPAKSLDALMDTLFQENLAENPEGSTQLGMDKGANAALKYKLRDESLAGVTAAKRLNASQLERLMAIDASALAGADRVN